MHIGILYPRSTAHPGMSMEFMDGIRSFISLHDMNEAIKISAENAGYGGVEKEVKEKIEKLLMIDQADILVLYIDQKMFVTVKPMLEASGKLSIIVNPGADYPQTWAASPNIIHLNLNHGFLCWLTGKMVGKAGADTAALATSFYDCGYLHSAMMVNSFNLHGGEIAFNYINNQAYNNQFHVDELLAYLANDKSTRQLLCVYDELPARLVYQALNAFDDATQLQLFVSPMMLQHSALENDGNGFRFSIAGHLPWTRDLRNDANSEMTGQILESTGKDASIFSLLGWEIAMILQKIMGVSLNLKNGSSIVDFLSHQTVDSPRGSMYLDRLTHWYLAPYLQRFIRNHSNELDYLPVTLQESDWKEYMDHPPQGVVSGWTNTYLCY